MLPEIHHGEVDGVPLIHVSRPGPTTVKLVFRVGMRDEPPHLLGITHLVEHLLFDAMGDVVPVHNGHTGISVLELEATGSDAEVVDFLGGLARVVRELPFDDAMLQRQRRVLAAELTDDLTPTTGSLAIRFGLGGVGSADAGAPTLVSVTVDEARAWARRWLVREHATLAVLGDLPAGLTLDLPSGPSEPPAGAPAHLLTVPTIGAVEGVGGVVLSLLLPERSSLLTSALVESDLQRALRTERALVYSVDSRLTLVDAGTTQLDLRLDPLPDDVEAVVTAAVQHLRAAAQSGFHDHTWAGVISGFTSASRHREAIEGWVDDVIWSTAAGVPHQATPEEVAAQAREADRATVTAELARTLDSLLVLVEEQALETDLDELAEPLGLAVLDDLMWREVPDGTEPPRDGLRFRGRGMIGLRPRLTIEREHAWLGAGGELRRFRLADVAVAGRFADGSVGLIDHRARSHVLDPADYRQGHRATSALLDLLPDTVVQRDFSWFDDPPHRRDQEQDGQ